MSQRTVFTLVIALGLALLIGLQPAQTPDESGPTQITEVTGSGGTEGALASPVPDRVDVPARDRVPGFSYSRPQPGEPDYEDYQAMLSHERYARFVHEGSKPPFYDPEWRAPIEGRREVPVNDDLQLVGGASSLDELVTFVFLAIAEEDGDTIDQMRLNRAEFEGLCWPEFPQSRPYLRIPAQEAWMMHFAAMRKGARKALNLFGGKHYDVIDVRVDRIQEFTNFRLHDGVVLTLEDADGKRETLDFIASIIECRGKFKVFMYDENFEYAGDEDA